MTMAATATETTSLIAFALPSTPYSVQMARFYIRAALTYHDLGDFIPERNLVNAELAWARHHYRVTLFATNAFDSHYIIATNIGLRYAGNPGQYGIRVERHF